MLSGRCGHVIGAQVNVGKWVWSFECTYIEGMGTVVSSRGRYGKVTLRTFESHRRAAERTCARQMHQECAPMSREEPRPRHVSSQGGTTTLDVDILSRSKAESRHLREPHPCALDGDGGCRHPPPRPHSGASCDRERRWCLVSLHRVLQGALSAER